MLITILLVTIGLSLYIYFDEKRVGIRELSPLAQAIKGWIKTINSTLIWVVALPFFAKLPFVNDFLPEAIQLILVDYDLIYGHGEAIFLFAMKLWDTYRKSVNEAIAANVRGLRNKAIGGIGARSRVENIIEYSEL